MHGYGTYEFHLKQRLLNEILEQSQFHLFFLSAIQNISFMTLWVRNMLL